MNGRLYLKKSECNERYSITPESQISCSQTMPKLPNTSCVELFCCCTQVHTVYLLITFYLYRWVRFITIFGECKAKIKFIYSCDYKLHHKIQRLWSSKVRGGYSENYFQFYLQYWLFLCFSGVYTLKIKKICFSSKMSIQPCRPKSDSTPSGAILALFKPQQTHQKAIPAHAGPISALPSKSALGNWTVLALI